MTASYRHELFDTLFDLTALSRGEVEGAVTWSAEYYSRGKTWYRFDDAKQAGSGFTEGLLFDRATGETRAIAAELLTFTVLDFQDNAFIGAYAGNKRVSASIASEIVHTCRLAPELLTVSIGSERQLECGRMAKESTQFVFVGFERFSDAIEAGKVAPLWNEKLGLTLRSRGRIRFFDDGVFQDDWDEPFPSVGVRRDRRLPEG